MRLLFIRIDKKRFRIEAGRSCSRSRQRELATLEKALWYCDPLHPIRHTDIDWRTHADARREFAEEMIRFVKKHAEYTFWEAFDFYGEEFSYTAQKKLFFEKKKQGVTLADAIQAMKKT